MRQSKFTIVLVMAMITLLLISCTKRDDENINNINSQANLPIQMLPPKTGDEVAIVETDFGDIKFILFTEKAPLGTEYFKDYVESNYYINRTFDRLEPNMSLQLDFNSTYPDNRDIKTKQLYTYESCNNIKNIKGAVCLIYQYGEYVSPSIAFVLGGEVSQENLDLMKYLGEEAYTEEIIEAYEKHGGQPTLDGRFTVIGQVFKGLDVLDKINTFEVEENEDNPSQHLLIEPISIKSITIETIK